MSASAAGFKPIHHLDPSSSFPDSRPNSVMSSTTDSCSENESQLFTKPPRHSSNSATTRASNKVSSSRDSSTSPTNGAINKHTQNSSLLLRRSSSVARVQELREVLATMMEDTNEASGGKEVPMTGSQNARLLVASQQCLVSRLQDLRLEMESMDNEVTRVRNDIVNSRRYFSAMMGVPCGPEWATVRQTDSAYTSPTTSFISRSADVSPYSSDNDSLSHSASRTAFQQLQRFDSSERRRGYKPNALPRSDSCSSSLSWRSDVEMADLLPDDHSSPQITPRAEKPPGATAHSRIRRQHHAVE